MLAEQSQTRREEFENIKSRLERLDGDAPYVLKNKDLFDFAEGLKACMFLWPILEYAIKNPSFPDKYYNVAVGLCQEELGKLSDLIVSRRYN